MRERLRIPARCWAAFAAVCGVLSCQASVFPHTATREYDALTTATAYSYNAANQLTGWTEQDGGGIVTRSATLGYDNRGNRASQEVTTTEAGGNTTGAAAQNTAYQWDHQNRLTGVTAPDGGQHAYRYDYRTRRIGRDEPGPGATVITYTGGLALAEYPVSSILDPVSSPAQPAVEYRRGPDMGGGIGGLLYSLRGGQAKFNLSNGRGDIVAQSDAGAQVTWTASYEAFGKRPVESGHNADRQRANTKEEDPTGLLHEHFRYRDLETGVWLSRDPAGFVDGPNLYAYVRQNPWSAFDPEGLFLGFVADAGFAIWDTYQYAAGNIDGAEYSTRMGLTGASLIANAASGGTAGLAVRGVAIAGRAAKVGNAVVKTAKAVDKANNAYETGQAIAENGSALVESVGEGDVRGIAKAAVNLGIEAAGGKKADQTMGAVENSQRQVKKAADDAANNVTMRDPAELHLSLKGTGKRNVGEAYLRDEPIVVLVGMAGPAVQS